MNGAMLLHHAAGVVEHREGVYGPPEALFAAVGKCMQLVVAAALQRSKCEAVA